MRADASPGLLIRAEQLGIDVYAVHYRPGCLKEPPWGSAKCDCFVILGDRDVDPETARSLAFEIASLNNDWVYVYGTHSEKIHDLIDEASVALGRQEAVGDGVPMTAWHTDLVRLEAIAPYIPGAQPVSVVILVGQDDYALEQLKRKIIDHLLQRDDSDQPLRARPRGVATEHAIMEFLNAARAACNSMEQFDVNDRQSLLPPLTRLLHAAESLRPLRIEIEDTELQIAEASPPFLERLPEDSAFYVLFDPLDANSVVATTLKNCLSDIYASLKGGLNLLQRSPHKRLHVVWELRSNYEFHWGRQLLDAIRFLMLT
jgi:hypothetical protein